MVKRCLEYNYSNSSAVCIGDYQKCGRQVECRSGDHCFAVWKVENSTSIPISAGCNAPYHHSSNETCDDECIGQPKGKRYYCCCNADLCNLKFKLPPSRDESHHQPKDDELKIYVAQPVSLLWFLIPIVILFTLVAAWWLKGHNKRIINGTTRAGGDCIEGANEILMTAPQPEHHQNNMIKSNIMTGGKTIVLSEEAKIGSGRFGTVYKATLNDDTVAVKTISRQDHSSWLNELEIYNSPNIKHQNILNFLYSEEHEDHFRLVIDYASKGSLYKFLNENKILWNDLFRIALGIVHGLAHLHEVNIVHRDFKSKNVLLKHDLTPCITDFGVATTLGSQIDEHRKYTQVGTPRYLAPEVLECSVLFTKASFTKIDVYALSLVLWELVNRYGSDTYKMPFEEEAGQNPDTSVMKQIVVVEKRRPIIKDEWRETINNICRAIEDGWEYDYDARISASCFVERIQGELK